jgi:hypothetical protein
VIRLHANLAGSLASIPSMVDAPEASVSSPLISCGDYTTRILPKASLATWGFKSRVRATTRAENTALLESYRLMDLWRIACHRDVC